MVAKLLYVIIIIAAAGGHFSSANAQTSPEATVAAFYKFDAANSQAFELKSIEVRKRWFSSDLYSMLLRELSREKEYLAKNPGDKPHFGDGLPFRPLDEACEANGKSYRRSIAYGKATVRGRAANVDVYFKYPKVCKIPDVLFAVNMTKERGRWVIDDIRYIDANSSLAEDLKRAEY